MVLTETIYHVVPLVDFLQHLIATQSNFAGADIDELIDQISDSGRVSFGDAVDTLVHASEICKILECDVPSGIEPNKLVGLGS